MYNIHRVSGVSPETYTPFIHKIYTPWNLDEITVFDTILLDNIVIYASTGIRLESS